MASKRWLLVLVLLAAASSVGYVAFFSHLQLVDDTNNARLASAAAELRAAQAAAATARAEAAAARAVTDVVRAEAQLEQSKAAAAAKGLAEAVAAAEAEAAAAKAEAAAAKAEAAAAKDLAEAAAAAKAAAEQARLEAEQGQGAHGSKEAEMAAWLADFRITVDPRCGPSPEHLRPPCSSSMQEPLSVQPGRWCRPNPGWLEAQNMHWDPHVEMTGERSMHLWTVDSCKLHRFTPHEARTCTRHHNGFMFVGDSLSRQQFNSMMYFFAVGDWPYPTPYPPPQKFFRLDYGTHRAPSEAVQPQGGWDIIAYPDHGNMGKQIAMSVTWQKYGWHGPSAGGLSFFWLGEFVNGSDVSMPCTGSMFHDPCEDSKGDPGDQRGVPAGQCGARMYLERKEDAIDSVVPLEPMQPGVVIFNTGLWPESGWCEWESEFKQRWFRRGSRLAKGACRVWKYTTYSTYNDNLRVKCNMEAGKPEAAAAAGWMRYDVFNMTKAAHELDPVPMYDVAHFYSYVYRGMNELLLNQMCAGEHHTPVQCTPYLESFPECRDMSQGPEKAMDLPPLESCASAPLALGNCSAVRPWIGPRGYDGVVEAK